MDEDGCFVVLIIIGFMIFLGYMGYRQGAHSVKVEAVQKGYATWDSNSHGYSTFRWKASTELNWKDDAEKDKADDK